MNSLCSFLYIFRKIKDFPSIYKIFPNFCIILTIAADGRVKEETEMWLNKAIKDYEDGKFNLEGDKREVAAFLFQQALEKGLKAIQIEERGEHDFTHDLVKLADEKTYNEFEDLFLDLNPVYTGFRYPDVSVKDIEDLDEIEKKTEEFIGWTKKRLKK